MEIATMFDVSLIELIDTLWNVNLDRCQNFFVKINELIDTLWNVNLNSAVML